MTRFLRSAPESPGVVGGELGQIDVVRERNLARVDLEDRLAAGLVGQVDDDAPVEAAGPQQRLVEHVGLVGRGQHDDALAAREAVHLGEDLVQRLLLLARAADRNLSARAPDRVDLVDEDDRGRVLARLLEQIAHARRADADDHLDELRGAHREEGHARLAGDRPREQRLAGAGRADEQHALRRGSAEARVLLGLLQEVDDLDQLVLGFVDARDVLEGDLRGPAPGRSGAPCSGRCPSVPAHLPPPCCAARRNIQT